MVVLQTVKQWREGRRVRVIVPSVTPVASAASVAVALLLKYISQNSNNKRSIQLQIARIGPSSIL